MCCKSFNVTGARISFLVGRRDVIAACKKLRTQIDFGMFLPIQKVAIAASTFAPLLLLGVWWRRLSVPGAFAGLIVGGGLATTATIVTK